MPEVSKKLKYRLFGGTALLLALLLINPINSGYVRLGILFLSGVLWFSSVLFLWRRPVLRWLPLALGAVTVTAVFLPGRPFDQVALRDAYVDSLQAYEGVWYCWGGENRVGIDCSGLVRRGFFAANLKQSIRTFNPDLLRWALYLWWYDASARELQNGYRDNTLPRFEAESINMIDHERLLPGDFAITRGGIHALVYLGDLTWLEADPGPMRVIKVKVPAQNNSWFNVPVHIMRWRLLETS